MSSGSGWDSGSDRVRQPARLAGAEVHKVPSLFKFNLKLLGTSGRHKRCLYQLVPKPPEVRSMYPPTLRYRFQPEW